MKGQLSPKTSFETKLLENYLMEIIQKMRSEFID